MTTVKEATKAARAGIGNRATTAIVRQTWPAVRDKLGRPAHGQKNTSSRRRVVEETVWVLRREGMLMGAAERRVIDAAKAMVDADLERAAGLWDHLADAVAEL